MGRSLAALQSSLIAGTSFNHTPRRMQPVFTANPARFLNRRRTRTRTAEGFLKTH
jgi:hypothetical protein